MASWIGSERHSISMLEKETGVVKGHLAAHSSGSGADATSPTAKSPDQLAQEKGPTDLQKIAAQMTETRSGVGLWTYFRIDEKFSTLSKEELISALDEIATVDMSGERREELQVMLLHSLCEKDPEYALKRYFGVMDDQNAPVGWRLAQALASWAAKNPAAATAWFDQQIAAGKLDSKSLDGKNPARMRFEFALIVALNSTDPAAAVTRLKSLPEEGRKVTREDLDAIRTWAINDRYEETADKVTGVALAYSTQGPQKLGFDIAASIATYYHEASGNDEVLIGFLMAYEPDDGSKEGARVLATKISDVKKREEVLSRFK